MIDVLVIGSGAGGGPLALRLAQGGLEVLVLEKGPRYSMEEYRHDELQAVAEGRDPFIPGLADDPHVVIDNDAHEPAPKRSALGWIASCVGGGTEHMGGTLLRFHPDDFRMRSRFGGFEALADWPYGYDDLEPFYTLAEQEIGISGVADNVFEGHRSLGYPMPPLRTHPLGSWLDGACRTIGLRPFTTPRAINSQLYGGRPACAYCALCAGFGCPTGARGSVGGALLPRAEATGRCTVRAGAMVREITLSARGRATGCVFIDSHGVERRVRARVVCICCSAVESARLLLLSRSPAFPDGLANGSGAVGRNLQFHVRSNGAATFHHARHPEKSLDDPNPFLLRSLMDFYFLPAGVSPLAKGGVHRFDMERTQPIAAAHRTALHGPEGIMWGAALQRRLRQQFLEEREVTFEVFQDYIPGAHTWMELDPDVVDRWGVPVARIHLSVPDHHRLAGEWLVQRGLEVLDAMGADSVRPVAAGVTTRVMTHGTCRAGNEPRTSVLDGFCRAHEVPNLFVVDGSFMPTSGGSPSTLSILANSFRTADYISDRARTFAFGA